MNRIDYLIASCEASNGKDAKELSKEELKYCPYVTSNNGHTCEYAGQTKVIELCYGLQAKLKEVLLCNK